MKAGKPMKFRIGYVELKNGKKPFKEFVLSLTIKERAKVFETINYFMELKNQNLPIKKNISKHLEDGIYEIRIEFVKKIARSLYFYQKGAKIILTHGFIKKTQKTPRKEIEKAKRYRLMYEKKG
jgi:phage-related protein